MEQSKTWSEITVNPGHLLAALVKKSWIPALCGLLCAAAAFLGTLFLAAPQYGSGVVFYINNDTGSGSITSSDISASKNLAGSYIAILNTRTTLEAVLDRAGVDLTCAALWEMIEARALDDTVLLEVTVTAEDPRAAFALAEAVAAVLPERISQSLKGVAAEVVDPPAMDPQPKGPNYLRNAVTGYALGLVLSAGAVIVWQIVSDVKKQRN